MRRKIIERDDLENWFGLILRFSFGLQASVSFINRIQEEPSFLASRQPGFKSLVGSYLKGFLEISEDMLEAKEERRLALRPQRVCNVAGFSSFARTGLRQKD